MKLEVDTRFGLGDEFYYVYLTVAQLNNEDHAIWRVAEADMVKKIKVTYEDRSIIVKYNDDIAEKMCFVSKKEALKFCDDHNER